jgi:hypothetical protein
MRHSATGSRPNVPLEVASPGKGKERPTFGRSTSLGRSSMICVFKNTAMHLQPTTGRIWAYGDCCYKAWLLVLP